MSSVVYGTVTLITCITLSLLFILALEDNNIQGVMVKNEKIKLIFIYFLLFTQGVIKIGDMLSQTNFLKVQKYSKEIYSMEDSKAPSPL